MKSCFKLRKCSSKKKKKNLPHVVNCVRWIKNSGLYKSYRHHTIYHVRIMTKKIIILKPLFKFGNKCAFQCHFLLKPFFNKKIIIKMLVCLLVEIWLRDNFISTNNEILKIV